MTNPNAQADQRRHLAPKRPRLIAICAGSIRPFRHLESAIIKNVISSIEKPLAISLQRSGLEGDQQAEVGIHGGAAKAIYMYPVEHWTFWAQQSPALGHRETIRHGFVGENLSVEGLSEAAVYAGDHLMIGDVRLQITEPRVPCLKFNWRMGYSKAAKQMIQSGLSGWYCAVLQTGKLIPGTAIELIPGRRLISIAEQLRLQQKQIERQLDLF